MKATRRTSICMIAAVATLIVCQTLVTPAALVRLFGDNRPRLYALFSGGNRFLQWMLLSMTAFSLFLWGNGLRVLFILYPDPQWRFGLTGFAAFIFVIFMRPVPAMGPGAYKPARQGCGD